MINVFGFIDAAPDPVGLGIVAIVLLVVIGFIFLFAAALVIFLWYRKRSMRHQEIGGPKNDAQYPQ